MQHRFDWRLFFAMTLIAAPPVWAIDPTDVILKWRPFLNTHCVACHGADVHERGLRFDKLAFNLADKDNFAIWVKVLDKVSRGEMPPKDEPRPAEKDVRSFSHDFRRRLHEVSLDQQRREGRVVMRRLNRNEYETTLRDLFGKQVEVKDLLPDDNIAAGFDNVSAVLDVSSVHLLRFQDAAEKAILSVVPNRPPTEIKDRRTGRQITEQMKTFKDVIGKSVRLIDDTLLMNVRTYGHIPCSTATVPQAGRYRVRASMHTVGMEGKPLPVMCSVRLAYGREDNDIRLDRDVPAGKTFVIDEEFELKNREMVVFTGWSLPSERDFAPIIKGKSLEDYAGPGLAVEWVEIEGPLDPFPSKGVLQLFGGVPLKAKSIAKAEAEGRPLPPQPAKRNEGQWIYDPLVLAPVKPREDAERLIRTFLPVAFRRPVDGDLADYFVKLVHDQLDKGASFLDAMTVGYKAVLCSTHFLYLNEAPTNARLGTRLDYYAVASRLSYFLWSSLPDKELLGLAENAKLLEPETLRAQVERMLKDEKGKRFAENFAGQWLELRNINATSPDPQIYGEFDTFLFWSMPQETQLFFDEILKNDLPVTDFVDSKWTFLNQRLAQHYGIADVMGGELRKVTLPVNSHRGGVMTHASVLKVTADGTRTSPVLRGKWVLEHMLGQTPAPPPPDVPAIDPDIRGATTIRQQLDKHRNIAACAVCHVHIDPPGFALESFDVIGGWRDFYRATRPIGGGGQVDLVNYPGRKVYRGPDVELGYQTADGQPFQNINDYKQILMKDKDQIARNLAQKLIIYATGADIQFADREVVDELVVKCREKNYGFRTLLHEVVQSRVFLNK